MSTATDIKSKNFEFSSITMLEADYLSIEQEEDWGKEKTIFTFEDGSILTVCNDEIKAS